MGKLLCFHNNKYVGLADSTGKVIVDARYNNVEYFGNGLYAIVKDSIAGIVNEEGTFVLPIKYRQIQNEEKFNGLKIRDCEGDVILEDTSGVVSRYDKKSNKIISAYKPYYLKRINNQTQYGEKGKVCLVDSNNVVVSGIYDKIYPKEPNQLDYNVYEKTVSLSWIEPRHIIPEKKNYVYVIIQMAFGIKYKILIIIYIFKNV